MNHNITFALKEKKIVVWDNTGNYWREIADVIEKTSCKKLIRTAQLAQEIEEHTDRYIKDIYEKNCKLVQDDTPTS